MMVNILVTGGSGQLGREVCNLLDFHGINYIAPASKELDITNEKKVIEYLVLHQPNYIIHSAAYTNVDYAEKKELDINWLVNANGTTNIAKTAASIGATLFYISTDYVFDGQNNEEYLENDYVNPINEYGKAKLEGEQAVQKYLTKYYIIRTSWVFGEFGKNFVYTMLNLSRTHDSINVVADQVGRPTWTKNIAEFILHLYTKESDFGIYQLSNEGSCTWFEFACEILKEKNIEINKISSEEYKQIAQRPKKSIMSLEKSKSTGFTIPHWKEALRLFLSTTE